MSIKYPITYFVILLGLSVIVLEFGQVIHRLFIISILQMRFTQHQQIHTVKSRLYCKKNKKFVQKNLAASERERRLWCAD